MSNPFPLPLAFDCPYCGQQAISGGSDSLSNELLHFSHTIKECKKVGQVISVILHTSHQFVVKWNNEKSEWLHADVRFGSSKVIERVELGDGGKTRWHSCDES